MAYKQKNNPFKKITEPTVTASKSIKSGGTTSNPNDIKLAKRLNKLRFDMGHIYPITSREEIQDESSFDLPYFKNIKKNDPKGYKEIIQRRLDETAQSEQERKELYKRDIRGEGGDITGREVEIFGSQEQADKKIYEQDLRFIDTARKAGGEVFNKVMSMPEKDIANLERDIVATAQPFRGKNLGDDPVATLKELRNLDLTKFKPYLKKSGLTVDDINKVITSELNNQPDYNKDGTPDAFEGLTGKVLKSGIDYLVSSKLKDLK